MSGGTREVDCCVCGTRFARYPSKALPGVSCCSRSCANRRRNAERYLRGASGGCQETRDLASVSAERWAALYWSAESGLPSTEALDRRFGVPPGTVWRRLRRAGIRVRTRGEQQKIDLAKGRVALPRSLGRPDWGLGSRLRELTRARLAAGGPRGHAPRRRHELPCGWCGAWVSRTPCQIRPGGAFCSRSHVCHLTNWRRARGGAPRPPIIERLRALGRLRPDGARYDPHERRNAVERKGKEIGATWEEVFEAIARLEEEAGQS
jgi:hypothetical protein